MNLEQLIARQAEIDTKQKAILAAAGSNAMTAEQATEFDSLQAEYDANATEVTRLQADAERRRKAATRTLPTASQAAVSGAAGGQALSGSESGGTRIAVKPPEKFASLGDQLQAIASCEMSGREDNRLQWGYLEPSAAVSGAGSGVPSDGGYLVEKDLMTDMMSKMYADAALLSRVRRIPVSANSNGLKINMVDETSRATGSRWGGVQVYWGAEADSATAKKPKFRQASLELKDLIGLMYATERLLQDAAALESVFQQAFTEEMTFAAEDAIINGLGAGQPLGLLASDALVSVSKETGQAAATLQYENVNKMWSRMWARSRGNAVWLINQDVEPQLHSMVLPAGTGGVPVYLPPGGLSQSPYGSLFGRPIIPTEYQPSLGTVGDIMLVDLSQYVVIEKGGLQADSSVHVRFINNERTFRFIYRLDGQPTWNSPLTPAKGTNTLSPFVALATRS